MLKYIVCCGMALWLVHGAARGRGGEIELSLGQSVERLREKNLSLQIADRAIDWARGEHRRVSSFWYPSVSVTGAYLHMANADRGRAAVEPVHRSGQGFHPLDPARRPNHFGPSGPYRHLYPSLPAGSAGCGDDRRERDLAGVRRGKTNRMPAGSAGRWSRSPR